MSQQWQDILRQWFKVPDMDYWIRIVDVRRSLITGEIYYEAETWRGGRNLVHTVTWTTLLFDRTIEFYKMQRCPDPLKENNNV